MSKILLSGVKPTGRPHIGNYFGAMKQMVDLQNEHKNANNFFMIADYHALNSIQDAKTMREHTLDLALDYLAIGIDPNISNIFKQSDVTAHTELTWIFDSITSMPFLMRAHAFKAQVAKLYDKKMSDVSGGNVIIEKRPMSEIMVDEALDISVGTFNYPVLMAADILLYNTDLVPVGQDQKQHIEYTRDIAQKFNSTFGETFKLPEEVILKDSAIIPGIDGQKMSKSYNNTIPLFSTRDEITKAVMSIVTDSSGDVPTNVYNIHRLFRTEEELKTLYDANKGKYKILKEALIDDLDTFIKPLRDKRADLAKDLDSVRKILEKGSRKANEVASAKMMEVKKAIGVI
jgi:tryptophanyl-tRNA synthetase